MTTRDLFNKTLDPTHAQWKGAIELAITAFLGGLVIFTLLYSILFSRLYPQFAPSMHSNAAKVVYPGKSLTPVNIGSGGVQGDALVINELMARSEAVLRLDTRFPADDYPFIYFDVDGLSRFTQPVVFWRTDENPDQLNVLPLQRKGNSVTQVSMAQAGDSYQGMVTEVAIGFFDGPELTKDNNNDISLIVHSIELRPMSLIQVAWQIYSDITAAPTWQGTANNIVRGTHGDAIIYPNLLLNLIFALAVALLIGTTTFARVERWQNLETGRPLLVLFLAFWIISEAFRWNWRYEQLADSYERYHDTVIEKRTQASPVRCARFPEDCRSDLLPVF